MPDTVRILVVDDEPEMRALLVDELRRDGHQVTEAARRGRARLRTRPFDVILIDKNMPDRVGCDLLPSAGCPRRGSS